MPSIRASATTSWPDCQRRLVANSFTADLEALGYKFEARPTHVGAHVGTAAHAGVAVSWRGVIATGRWASMEEADEATVESLHDTFERDGVLFDATTESRNDAEIAARKIIRAYRGQREPTTIPLAVEGALEARFREGWTLTGHVDLAARDAVFVADATLDDLKTGVWQPTPGAQLGSYDLLLGASGVEVDAVTMTFVRRVRRNVEQPPPLKVAFDRGVIRRQARAIIHDIATKHDAFLGNAMPEPFAFNANPASRLCGSRFCRAFHTPWCPESKEKPDG